MYGCGRKKWLISGIESLYTIFCKDKCAMIDLLVNLDILNVDIRQTKSLIIKLKRKGIIIY